MKAKDSNASALRAALIISVVLVPMAIFAWWCSTNDRDFFDIACAMIVILVLLILGFLAATWRRESQDRAAAVDAQPE